MNLLKTVFNKRVVVQYIQGDISHYPNDKIEVYDTAITFTEGKKDMIIPFHNVLAVEFTDKEI